MAACAAGIPSQQACKVCLATVRTCLLETSKPVAASLPCWLKGHHCSGFDKETCACCGNQQLCPCPSRSTKQYMTCEVCRASLEYLKVTKARPDILHVHEWQLSAVPMLYWEAYHKAGLPTPRIVLTIHCMDNSGECREDEFAFTGVLCCCYCCCS